MSGRIFAIGIVVAAVIGIGSLYLALSQATIDPLPSWQEGPVKQAILDYVRRVTSKGGRDYVPPEHRVATFDNDGTLWSEKPLYFQLQFALDRVRALAPERPEWRDEQPFKAVLEDDQQALMEAGMEGLVSLVNASHAGMTEAEFAGVVREWLQTARHPRFDRPYNELTYAPMVELLYYLRRHEFQVWICSGGGIDFMRSFVHQAYGVPPEQVIGSTGNSRFELRDDSAVLVKEPGIANVNDKATKPVGIGLHIGRRPILAGGNSDGDLAMMQFTDRGEQPALMLLVHHDDAEREWAYDQDSHVGQLDEALVEAKARGWTVVSMKRDWRRIYGFEALPR